MCAGNVCATVDFGDHSKDCCMDDPLVSVPYNYYGGYDEHYNSYG